MSDTSGLTISGLGSGIDYESWITKLVAIKQAKIDDVSSQVSTIQKKESALSTLKTNYSSLLDKIKAFTDSYSSSNVFKKKTATSSSDAVSVTATSSATAQDLKVTVTSLATATVAKSTDTIAAAINSSTKLSDIAEGAITDGTLSIYKDGTKYSFNVDKTTTLGDLLTNIKNTTGLDATVSSDGKVSIGAGSSSTVVVGSNADTSNISKVLSLVKNDDGSYSSSKSIFSTDTTAALTSTSFAKGTVTAGTFTIGTAQFTVDSTKTMDDLIAEINKNKDAGVTASWDSNAGKLVLTATDEGAVNINIEAGTSNFTDIMGLTSSGSLASGSQTLGTNAVLSINGTTITSASNTVTSDVTGIAGVTLTLNDKTTSTANISVSADNDAMKTAVNDFVSAFNSVMSQTASATGKTGTLNGESVLNMLKNSVRGEVTQSATNTGSYKTLADIGITTGAIGSSTKANTDMLVVDSSKLAAALADDPDSVKKLLTGDDGASGVLGKMQTTLSNSLNETNGYFVKRNTSYEDQVDKLNDKITKMTDELEKYQKTLEAKFSAMDKLISNLQSQATQMDSLLGTSSSSKSSSK